MSTLREPGQDNLTLRASLDIAVDSRETSLDTGAGRVAVLSGIERGRVDNVFVPARAEAFADGVDLDDLEAGVGL